MSYTMNKTLSGDFPNGLKAGKLHIDIQTAFLASATIEAVTTNTDEDYCKIFFDVEPSASDKTAVDNIVSSYTYSNFSVDPVLNTVINEHFMISNINAGEIASYNWTKSSAGANAEINKKTFPGRPGNVQLVTGQEASGFTAIHIGSDTEGLSFETGTFNKIECEAYFMIENTVSASDFDYALIGFSDDNDILGMPPNAGAIFFNPSESPNIQMKTVVAGLETSIISSVPVVIGTWYHVKFIYYDLVTNPKMAIFIDGKNEGEVNFTMPLSSTPFSPTIKVDGKNGTNKIKLNVDYYIMKEDYNYTS